MPTALILPVEGEIPRKQWSREEYRQVSEEALGGQRLELVLGELVTKMGKKRPHVLALNQIRRWLEHVFGERFVNAEAPIDVAVQDNLTSEPEPDLIVLKRPEAEFKNSNPGSSDLRLVVEISETTLTFDLTKKARLYARAAIAEYWVVDLQGRRIIVHRDPVAGQYRAALAFAEDESVAPLAAPSAEICFRDDIDQE